MTNEKTIRRIMDAVGIKQKQMDLTEKVLELENDSGVNSIRLHHGTMDGLNLWAEVLLKEGFRSLPEFIEYLGSRGLPQEETRVTIDKGTYILENDGVRVEFKKPEFYSCK